jgi:hypothetical protein
MEVGVFGSEAGVDFFVADQEQGAVAAGDEAFGQGYAGGEVAAGAAGGD